MDNYIEMVSDIENHNYKRLIKQHEIHYRAPLSKKLDPYFSDIIKDIIEEISVLLKKSNDFFPDFIDLNEDNIKITRIYKEFQQRIEFDDTDSISVLIGKVGIGKTSFIKWFRKNIEIRGIYSSLIDLNTYKWGFDEEEHTLDEISADLYDYILSGATRYFVNKLQTNQVFNSNFNELLTKVQRVAKAENDKNWITGFLNQSETFVKKYPNYDQIFLLTFLIYCTNLTIRNPIWVIIDNLDRLIPKIQSNVIVTSHYIYDQIREAANSLGWNLCFHFILTARPETVKFNDFDFKEFNPIIYPEPQILKIAKDKLFSSINKVERKQNNNVEINLLIRGKSYKNYSELAATIKDRVQSAFDNFAKIKNLQKETMASDRWHLSLVNNNIRRFIMPWSEMILSGNFVDDLIFVDENLISDDEFNVHRYFKMLIKCKYSYFYGNEKIDGYGYSERSPLFFNLFGFARLPGRTNKCFTENYLIYIRILQFLLGWVENGGVSFEKLNDSLRPYYSEVAILDALEQLLWARIIEEIETGSRDIGPHRSANKIKLKKNSILIATDTSKLYYHNILSEYDYISSMAMVSYQCEYTYSKNTYRGGVESIRLAEACLHFLENWLLVLKSNYENYRNRGLIESFIELFLVRDYNSRPWLRSVECCRKSLINKLEGAIKLNESDKVEKFTEIIKSIELLRGNGVKIMSSFFGDIYNSSLDY